MKRLRIDPQIINVHSRYRDQAIRIKDIQHISLQLPATEGSVNTYSILPPPLTEILLKMRNSMEKTRRK